MSIREDSEPILVGAEPLGKILPIDLIPQIKNNWCWAACAEMVFKHRSITVKRQCDLVLSALSASASSLDCCNNRPDGPCDLPASDKEITNLYINKGIRSATLVDPIKPDEIKAEIGRNAPVEIGYKGSGFGRGAIGHVVLLYGWQETPGVGLSFFIHNPLAQARSVRADFALPGQIDRGLWDATWKGL